ncbi:hypothetical protein C2S51_024047 [Perilla frutescens var. frutescens]|nr:hypothetical protein C2S51_024047 [Perilla frutescens var. frutescens]
MVAFRPRGRASRRRRSSRKWHWTREEDNLLTALVQKHGSMKWDKLATHIQGRSGKSCRIRWLNQLSPGIDKSPFSLKEKRNLLELHAEFGNRWSIIVSYFPGRTDNQVKNQYHMLVGTRAMKLGGSSPCNDPHGHLWNGSTGSSQNISIPPVGSDFSEVTSRGTGFAPLFSAMPSWEEMRPSFIGGTSSVYGRDENFTQVDALFSTLSSLGPHPNQQNSSGNSMISDASTAGIEYPHFIDFLGVGGSYEE